MQPNIDEVKKDNEMTRQAIMAEQAFDRKSDQFHKGQKELPPGRNFMWNTFRHKDKFDRDSYRINFDAAFPNAPGTGF